MTTKLEWSTLQAKAEYLESRLMYYCDRYDLAARECDRLRAALELVRDWRAVAELTDPKMAQIQQALGNAKDG